MSGLNQQFAKLPTLMGPLVRIQYSLPRSPEVEDRRVNSDSNLLLGQTSHERMGERYVNSDRHCELSTLSFSAEIAQLIEH